MQKSPNVLIFSLGLLVLSMAFNGLFVLGQSSLDASADSGWRRTTIGWEHADSLPVSTKGSVASSQLIFPTLSVPMNTIDYVHRLVLPLAISGFMACMGPWLLLRWPTNSIEKHSFLTGAE